MARHKGHNRNGRSRQQRINPLYNPTAVLAGPQLRKAANALVDLQYGPQKRAIRTQASNAKTQGMALVGNAGDYYKQLAQGAAGDVARQQAITSTLQSQLAASSSQSQQAMQTAATQATDSMAADAAVRGPGLSGGAGATLADETATQSGNLTQQSQAARDLASQTGSDYAALSDLTNRATAARGGEVKQQLLTQLANQQQGFRQQLTGLAGQEGAARTSQLQTLRQGQFENLVALRGLGIKQEQIQADAQQASAANRLANRRLTATNRQNRALNRLASKRIKATIRGQDISAATQRRGQDFGMAERAADRQSRERIAKLKGKTGMSTDAAKLRVGIDNMLADMTSDPKLVGAINNSQWRKVGSILTKRGASGIGAQAAVEIANVGYLSPGTLAALRRAGVKIPRSWRQTGAQAFQGPH